MGLFLDLRTSSGAGYLIPVETRLSDEALAGVIEWAVESSGLGLPAAEWESRYVESALMEAAWPVTETR